MFDIAEPRGPISEVTPVDRLRSLRGVGLESGKLRSVQFKAMSDLTNFITAVSGAITAIGVVVTSGIVLYRKVKALIEKLQSVHDDIKSIQDAIATRQIPPAKPVVEFKPGVPDMQRTQLG
jgi:hypothetical protein